MSISRVAGRNSGHTLFYILAPGGDLLGGGRCSLVRPAKDADLVPAGFLGAVESHDAQIFVLNGLQPGNEIAGAERGIVPVLNSLAQWRQWSATARMLKRCLPAVLQFDTGMLASYGWR